MNHIQRQSIAIMIQGIETQLQALRTLLLMNTNDDPHQKESIIAHPKEDHLSGRYTSDDEDREIGRLLEIERDRESVLVQDMFKQAHEEMRQDGGSK